MTILSNEPSYKWRAKTETVKSILDVFDATSINLTPEPVDTMAELANAMLANSFFLPADLLNSPYYTISPVYVISGDQLPKVLALWPRTALVESDFPMLFLMLAKHVGISFRINKVTCMQHVVLKLWYGNNPWENKLIPAVLAIKSDRTLALMNKEMFNRQTL